MELPQTVQAKFKNLLGQTFGRLTVIEYAGRNKHKATLWRCRCECGRITDVPSLKLRKTQRSCGCAKGRRTHGMTDSATYRTWRGMRDRCINPKARAFRLYGARGITVCERWMAFENFLADMGQRPEGMSIERIDNAGNYEPDNCRWATQKEQARNNRSNRILEFNGESKSVAEWAEVTLGCRSPWLQGRMKTCWYSVDT